MRNETLRKPAFRVMDKGASRSAKSDERAVILNDGAVKEAIKAFWGDIEEITMISRGSMLNGDLLVWKEGGEAVNA